MLIKNNLFWGLKRANSPPAMAQIVFLTSLLNPVTQKTHRGVLQFKKNTNFKELHILRVKMGEKGLIQPQQWLKYYF